MKKLAILLLVVAATAHADSDAFFDRLKAGGSPESIEGIEGIDKAKAFVEKTSAECLNNPNTAACAKRDELAAQFAKAGICYWPGDQQSWMTCGEYNRKAEEWNADLRARRAKQQDELQKLAPVGMLFWSDFSPPVAGQRDPTIVPMACRKFNVKPDNPKNTAISMNRPGFIVNESKGRGIGCLFSDKSGQAMVQWIETGNIDKVNSPRIKPPLGEAAASKNGPPAPNGAPTRADVDASFNEPRFDQYGRPMKSVNELCTEAKAAGGPVTPICAWNQWAKP